VGSSITGNIRQPIAWPPLLFEANCRRVVM
jgi:hypothetical protein